MPEIGESFGLEPVESRQPSAGMGMAVARRTVFRESDKEDWGRVADRVADGNVSLVPPSPSAERERARLRNAIATGALITSGRHLQHGDSEQVSRGQEVFTNCATSATTYGMSLLLLAGSGVGRSYDDDMMVVDWSKAPRFWLILRPTHPDFPDTFEKRKAFYQNCTGVWCEENRATIEEFCAQHIHVDVPDEAPEGGAIYHEIADSREGWAKAVEVAEACAFEGRESCLILNFSKIRASGSPIAGMQNRPCAGPIPWMRAFVKVQIRINPQMPLWQQAMEVDHAFAEEVLVGAVRRSARMSTKSWRDPGIMEFIAIKNGGGKLWSSNNSVMVDREFWDLVRGTNITKMSLLAKRIFGAITENSYQTGEPGIINGDKLWDRMVGSDRNIPVFQAGEAFSSKKYQTVEARRLLTILASKAANTRFGSITNPCQPGFAPVLTPNGISTIDKINPGDRIWSEDGWVTVMSKWSTGIKEVFRYRTSAGTLYSTENHKVVERGIKIEVKYAESIDGLSEPSMNTTLYNGTHKITDTKSLGKMKVFDITVSGPSHTYWSGGCNISNCGEITLSVMGGFCVIADACPILACPVSFSRVKSGKISQRSLDLWDQRVIESVKLAARFLIRVNSMDSVYNEEVRRTNRIGVALTGVHEWAWLRWGLGFNDLLDETRSQKFWNFVALMSRETKDESNNYSNHLGVVPPTTITTVKPSGTVSKLFNLTEGIHLPARRQYLRWVQFKGTKTNGVWDKDANPLLAEYEDRGYPVRELRTFPGMSIVGFPTMLAIQTMGIGDQLVTATEATPEQQYQWLRLMEKYWIGEQNGNQISYTLKVNTQDHSLDSYRKIVLENQPTVKCCSVLPHDPRKEIEYEYLPESPIEMKEFRAICHRVGEQVDEDVDMETLQCESGACPL